MANRETQPTQAPNPNITNSNIGGFDGARSATDSLRQHAHENSDPTANETTADIPEVQTPFTGGDPYEDITALRNAGRPVTRSISTKDPTRRLNSDLKAGNKEGGDSGSWLKNHWKTATAFGAGAAALATVVLGVNAGASDERTPEKRPAASATYDPTETVSSEEPSPLDEIYVGDFITQSLEERCEIAATELQRDKENIVSLANAEVGKRDALKEGWYIPNYNIPRDQWSGQDYLNDYTLGLLATTNVSGNNSEEFNANVLRNQKLFSLVSERYVEDFQDVSNSIGTEEKGSLNVYKDLGLPGAITRRENRIAAVERLRSGNNLLNIKATVVFAEFVEPTPGVKNAQNDDPKQFMIFIDSQCHGGNTTVSTLWDIMTVEEMRDFLDKSV